MRSSRFETLAEVSIEPVDVVKLFERAVPAVVLHCVGVRVVPVEYRVSEIAWWSVYVVKAVPDIRFSLYDAPMLNILFHRAAIEDVLRRAACAPALDRFRPSVPGTK